MGIRKNIEILRSMPPANRKYAWMMSLVLLTLPVGLSICLWMTDHFPFSVVRWVFVILIGGVTSAFWLIQRKARARYKQLPPTEQNALDTWRRDALLESKRRYKKFLVWIPIGTALAFWESRREEPMLHFLTLGMGAFFFLWIFVTVRSLGRQIDRLSERLDVSGEVR